MFEHLIYTYRDLNEGEIPWKTSADRYFSFGAWIMYLILKQNQLSFCQTNIT